METARDTGWTQSRHLIGQSANQQVTSARVAEAHSTDMPVEATRLDEVGEGQLVKNAYSAAGGALGIQDRFEEPWRHREPANAQTRSQCFAGSSRVDDLLRIEPLESPNRLALVAELTVIVVLNQHCAGI